MGFFSTNGNPPSPRSSEDEERLAFLSGLWDSMGTGRQPLEDYTLTASVCRRATKNPRHLAFYQTPKRHALGSFSISVKQSSPRTLEVEEGVVFHSRLWDTNCAGGNCLGLTS